MVSWCLFAHGLASDDRHRLEKGTRNKRIGKKLVRYRPLPGQNNPAGILTMAPDWMFDFQASGGHYGTLLMRNWRNRRGFRI